MADNYKFEIIHDERVVLDKFVDLVNGGKNSVGYIMTSKSLIIFKYENQEMTRFPFPYNQEMVCDFIWQWLKSGAAVYNQQPDHDGSNKMGYSITTTSEPGSIWYAPGGFMTASMKIEPAWCMYGK
jgi:hypothetical protein